MPNLIKEEKNQPAKKHWKIHLEVNFWPFSPKQKKEEADSTLKKVRKFRGLRFLLKMCMTK